jgi:hypothetical protein
MRWDESITMAWPRPRTTSSTSWRRSAKKPQGGLENLTGGLKQNLFKLIGGFLLHGSRTALGPAWKAGTAKVVNARLRG